MINPYRFGTEGISGGVWVQVHDDIYGAGTEDKASVVAVNDAGNRIVVGAPYGDNGQTLNCGYIKAYNNTGSDWVQVGQTLYGTSEYGYFGGTVKLNNSGDTFITNANLVSTSTGGQYSGAAYVYKLINGVWSQVGQTIDGTQGDLDSLGTEVAINSSGTRIAVGNFRYNTPANDGGAVRIFKLVNNSWVLMQTILSTTAQDTFGTSLDFNLDGTKLAIGAAYATGVTGGLYSGYVKVYENNSGDVWDNNKYGRLDPSPSGSYIDFGKEVRLSGDGNRLLVHANRGGLGNPPYTEIFDDVGGSWVSIHKQPNLNLNEAVPIGGVDLSTDGKTFMQCYEIGGYNDPYTIYGTARVYEEGGGEWGQVGQTVFAKQLGDWWPGSVGLNGNGSIFVAGGAHYAVPPAGFREGIVQIWQRSDGVGPPSSDPVVTINGDDNIEITFREFYQDAGATAVDEFGTDITADITVTGAEEVESRPQRAVDPRTFQYEFNFRLPGVYTIGYTVRDAYGRYSGATRTVTVVDDVPPTLALLGEAVVSIGKGSTYIEAGVTFDNWPLDVAHSQSGFYAYDYTQFIIPPENLVVGGDTVDINTVGTYIITYDINDGRNDAQQVTRTVNVVDLAGELQVDYNIDGVLLEPATRSVSFNGDATTMIVGDYAWENPRGTYGQSYAGLVKVYDWVESQGWVQKGQNFEGYSYTTYLGYRVVIDGTGNRIGILQGNQGRSDYELKFYDWNEQFSQWIQIGQTFKHVRIGSTFGEDTLNPTLPIEDAIHTPLISADGNTIAYVRYQFLGSYNEVGPNGSADGGDGRPHFWEVFDWDSVSRTWIRRPLVNPTASPDNIYLWQNPGDPYGTPQNFMNAAKLTPNGNALVAEHGVGLYDTDGNSKVIEVHRWNGTEWFKGVIREAAGVEDGIRFNLVGVNEDATRVVAHYIDSNSPIGELRFYDWTGGPTGPGSWLMTRMAPLDPSFTIGNGALSKDGNTLTVVRGQTGLKQIQTYEYSSQFNNYFLTVTEDVTNTTYTYSTGVYLYDDETILHLTSEPNHQIFNYIVPYNP